MLNSDVLSLNIGVIFFVLTAVFLISAIKLKKFNTDILSIILTYIITIAITFGLVVNFSVAKNPGRILSVEKVKTFIEVPGIQQNKNDRVDEGSGEHGTYKYDESLEIVSRSKLTIQEYIYGTLGFILAFIWASAVSLAVAGTGVVAGSVSLIIAVFVVADWTWLLSIAIAGPGALAAVFVLCSNQYISILAWVGTVTLIPLTILSYYISWRTLQEDDQFNLLRKLTFSLSTSFGTDFQSSVLISSDFTGANLFGAHFKHNHQVKQTIWRNAENMHMAYFHGTLLENNKVRNLLSTLDNNSETDFRSVNLQDAWLITADLHEADLRNSDLDRANLSFANITGAKLYATSRENWEIEGVKCKYIYWDEEGKERMPPDREFEPGEFEKLYKKLPTFDYFFEGNFTPIDMVIMDRVVQAINENHPEFELTLDSFSSRSNPHAKFTVVHKDYMDHASLEIKSEYETKIRFVEGQRDELRNVIAMLIDKPRITAKMIQGLTLAEHIDTINQQGGDMGDDHININAGGDVAFAKDQAFAQINKTITESANLPETLETKLKALSDAVQKMTQDLPDTQAKEVTQDLQTLTEEATKEAPRKKWYELSGQGIIDAAMAVGVAGKPVINLAREVMKLLGA
jgi:hypothetical protein